jgi:hypothetical protein
MGNLPTFFKPSFRGGREALEDRLACRRTVDAAQIHLKPGGRLADESEWSSESAK